MNKRGLSFLTVSMALMMAMSLTLGAVSTYAKSTTALRELSDAFVSVAKKVTPAVVAIQTETFKEVSTSPFRFFGPMPDLPKDHPFRRFFEPFSDEDHFKGHKRETPKKRFRRDAFGSGMIITSDGYILTNSHVVKNADKIEVTLSDKRSFKGKVVAQDPDTDIAVVKINAKNLPIVEFGNSDKLEVGELVLAIGGPFGLTKTVTSGIVSATGRDKVNITEYGDLIQTDAAINPGNSGGPLVNIEGKVIGVNVAIFSRSGGYQGIGFAIPSNTATYVSKKLRTDGKIRRGLLGVLIRDLTKPLAKSLGRDDMKGALVIQVNEDSAAEKAGIKTEDIIVKFNDKSIENVHELKNLVAKQAPGSKATVTIFRKGKEITKNVVLGEKESKAVTASKEKETEKTSGVLGVEIKMLSENMAEKLDLKKGEGVLVTGVDPDSSAETIGLKKGDIILEVDGVTIKSVSQFEDLCKKAKAKKLIRLMVKRGKQPPNIIAEELE